MAVIWAEETNGQLLLAERSKEELIEIILEKEREIQELKRKLGEKEKSEARKKFLKASCREYRNRSLRRLAKRFLMHWLHLLTFLEDPEIPFNNNLAERMIRPHVILRNRSFQNRSPEGAKAHETLMSLLHTLKLQRKDTITFLQKAYLRHRQGNLRPVLSF